MKKIENIIYSNSKDTGDGLEIDYKDIHSVIGKLESLQRKQISECMLYMLNYCFENVGSQNVDVNKEIEKWIKENQ